MSAKAGPILVDKGVKLTSSPAGDEMIISSSLLSELSRSGRWGTWADADYMSMHVSVRADSQLHFTLIKIFIYSFIFWLNFK